METTTDGRRIAAHTYTVPSCVCLSQMCSMVVNCVLDLGFGYLATSPGDPYCLTRSPEVLISLEHMASSLLVAVGTQDIMFVGFLIYVEACASVGGLGGMLAANPGLHIAQLPKRLLWARSPRHPGCR